MRAHRNQLRFYKTSEMDNTFFFIGMIKNMYAKILQSKTFSKFLRPLQRYNIGGEVEWCIDPDQVQMSIEEGLQCLT